MNNCKINSRNVSRVLSMAKRLGWNEDQIKNYCINNGYDYESIVNQKIKKDIIGVTENVAPTIPEIDQISKLDGYIDSSTDVTNNIISYYSDFSEELGVMKKGFEREVLTATFIDLNSSKIFKNPKQIISGKGSLLNNELRKLKIKYIDLLLDIIGNNNEVNIFRIQDTDSNDIKYKKFYAAINYSWNKLQNLKESDNYKKAINLYVKCKFFDKLIEDIPFVEINKQYRNVFDNNHYVFVQGKVKHFTGVSTDESASAINQMSNLSKTILNFIPECRRGDDGKLYPINGKTVTQDSFLSISDSFKKWIYSVIEDPSSNNKLRKEIIQEWSKGINADFKELFEKWISKHRPSSFEKNKINTIAYIIFGKYDNGEYITPDELRHDLASLLINTITSSYAEYDVNRGDQGIVNGITPTTLTEKKYLSIKKSTESNLIASAYNCLVNNFKISLPKSGVEALSILEKLLYAKLPDFEEFKRNSEIINGKDINPDQLLIKMVELIKEMSEYKKFANVSEFIRYWEENLNNSTSEFFSTTLNYIKALSLSKKTNYKSVILNSEGNNLPLRQLPSLAYAKNEVFFDMVMKGIYEDSPNTIVKNISNVLSPITKSSTVDGDTYKQFRQLESSDMIAEAIISDFLYNLYNPATTESGLSKYVIYLQPNCFADKSTNNIPGFNLSNKWYFEDENGELKKVDLYYLFTKIIEDNDENSKNILKKYWKISWFNELKKVYDNICSDYRRIFDLNDTVSNKETVSIFEKYIQQYGLDRFVNKAYKKGVDIVNNVHYVKGIVNGKSKFVFNPIIKALISITNSEAKFNAYYNDRLNKFLSMMPNLGGVNFTQYNNQNIIEAYFLAHNLLAEPYNRIMFGNYYGHDIKTDIKLDDNGAVLNTDELIDSAWKSQTKRLAIVGATYHKYSLGKEMGVADNINIAVINDETSYVINTNGEINDIDAKDGSGDVSPLFSRQANISLGSAKAGRNKKTIWHFYDHKYNTAGMLKWAEYEITNERMRDSWMSPTKEFVKFKKMHSIPFTVEQKRRLADSIDGNFNQGVASLYNRMKKVVFKDYDTGEFKTIKNIGFQYNSETDTLIAYSDVHSNGFEINNIYDIFQFFGGAWNYEWNNVSEKYIGSEYNLDVLNEIVCRMGLKNNFIAYAVNKSGMKTGIKNLNSTSVLTDDSDLKYFTENVKYGGLQMDADHTLEESESTEPSQMIGHIGQDGTSHEKIAEIYSLLSNEIGVELNDYLAALNSENKKEELTKLIGKSIVSAFERGDRDVISLANAFISKASRDGNYDIPFNSSSINSLFTSTLFSDMSKKTSKRKYTGVGAVLNPSYNSKMYYDINGKKIKFEELSDIIRSDIKARGLNITIDEYMKSIEINGELNPFMTSPVFVENNGIIYESNPIEIGGTYIVTYRNLVDDSVINREQITINNIHDLLKWRHTHLIGNYKKIEITVNSLAPRNLKGIDAIYDAQIDDKIYKISQIENPYNLALLHLNKDADFNLNNYLTDEFKELNPVMYGLIVEAARIVESGNYNYIRNLQKEFFNNLKVGGNFFGYTITNINVRPTEIMIGRLYAKELGLLPGDNVSDVDSNFFKKRMFDYYSIDGNRDRGYYDAILFDGSGEKLYVKINSSLDSKGFIENDDFIVRDDTVYNDNKVICSSHGKKFVKYIDSNNNVHNYCIVDNVDRINEMLKNHYTYVYKNLLESNLSVFGYNNEFGIDTLEYLKQSRLNEKTKLNQHIISVANNKYFAFRKSLNFVGTRIPCQSMQSFTPMRVVAFTDSDDNEIYIPTHEQWIEGSDYDIDKQYIIGYELLKNGKLITNFREDSSPYIKEIAIKNKIVETILSVISDHKNLTNLTATVSMDNLKALKKRASSNDVPGDSSNPASIFGMIVENASGKDTIGVTAVAGKAFSAICYYYNGLVKQVKGHIELGQYDSAFEILKSIPYIPNLDWSWVVNVLPIFNETDPIYTELLNRRDYSLNNDDAYLLIGEFLNASADNAKELILKKIKANGEWADIYIAGLIAGYPLDKIYNIMCENGSERFIKYKTKTILDDNYTADKIYGDKNALELFNASNDFISLYRLSLRLQLIGKLAGINQGFKTKKFDISQSISSIESSYKKILNWGLKKNEKHEFDLFKFFGDDNYREMILNIDNSFLSPLKIIYSHPLFRTQWLSFLTTIEISNSLSRKNLLDYTIGMTPYINKKTYNQEVAELDKSLNIKWLKSIGFKFNLNPNRKKSNLTDNDLQEFNESNVNRFLSTMEFYVIPKLKEQYPENYFIQSLTLGIRNIPESKTGEKTVYYKIPLNMMDIDNDAATADEYGKMFRGFNALSNIMFDDVNTIHNLLYVYEILINRTFSQSSMNRFFSESFINDPNKFIESHARFLDDDKSDERSKTYWAGPSIYEDYLIPSGKYYNSDKPSINELTKLPGFILSNPNIIIFNDNNYLNVLRANDIVGDEAEFVHNIGKAFVYNGKIFINSDKSDRSDLRHELTHVVIGMLKAQNKNAGSVLEAFYNEHKDKFGKIEIELKSHPIYGKLKSSDLLEEAIAHYVASSENNFKNFVYYASETTKLNDLEMFIKDVVNEENLSKLRDIQKVELLRDGLLKQGFVTENCI